MKSLFYSLFFCLLTGIFYFLGSGISYGQLKGISLGNSSPHTNSILDISSREKGVLFPRMTTAERQAIAIDAVVPTGLWVYDTDESAYYFYKSGKWELLGDSTFSKIRAFKQVGTDSLYLYQGEDSLGIQLILTGSGTIQNPDTANLSIRAANEGLVTGNVRGPYSVDLQTYRVASHQIAQGPYSTVSGGGEHMTLRAVAATVSGGNYNFAYDSSSIVSGGDNNRASGNYSTVSGGSQNRVVGMYSTVSGGRMNEAYDDGKWIGGVCGYTKFDDSRLFVVGNGKCPDTNRWSNALTLLKNAHLGIGIRDPQQRLDLGGSALPGLLRLGNMIATPSNKDSAKGSLAYNYVYNLPEYYTGTVWRKMKGGTIQSTDTANLSIRATNEGTVVGNIRGLHSVDLQTERDSAHQVASGDYSTASGGHNNTASGEYSTVGGGNGNTASRKYSMVGGGHSNMASGDHSTVGGGGGGVNGNTASGDHSTVGGGGGNTALMEYSTVGGGHSNTASGYYSTVGGGHSNAASGNYSVVSGGNSNTALGDYSTVSGGERNKASGDYSTVSGGELNTASEDYSTVSGGIYNTAASYGEWVGGLYATTYTPSSATSFNPNDRLFVVGNGTDTSARSNAFVIYKNGDATLAGTFTQGSDRRLKKDIEVLENSLGKIGRLAPQKYNWIDTSRNRQGKSVGLIAQEVEKVLPHLVKTQEGTMELNGVQIDGVKSVNYIGFIPYLIGAIQEIKVELDVGQESDKKLRTDLEIEKKNIQDVASKIEKMNNQMKNVFKDMEALGTVEQP